MLIKKNGSVEGKIASSEITPKDAFLIRRNFLRGAAVGVGALALKRVPGLIHPEAVHADQQLAAMASKYTVPDAQTPFAKATTYNNYYEFGTNKSDPAKNAHTLRTRPWTVQVSGMVKKAQTLDIDTIMKYRPIESRVYRHRCVEAWSMVIPWDGYSFSEFISAMEPLPSAKYVQFISDSKNSDMPDKPGGFDWPYSEGLRMDEAMNPLCLLTFGCYGEVLPNQNGAPIRVVSPWKYGFKNGKSIVKIVFTDKQPHTLWNEMAANEYGFYSNVNPQVDHPRWSQAHERRIDSSPFPKTIPTLMFNGYGDQVASMYAGMNLKKRRFIQVGLFAWVLLLALAVTSPAFVMRWMGGKAWRRVHYAVYVAALAGCVHYWWLVKKGVREPLPFTLVLAVLLLARMIWAANKRLRRPTPVAGILG